MAVALSNSTSINRAIVFMLTYFSYVFIHAARKTFSNVKSAMMERWLAHDQQFGGATTPHGKGLDPFLDTPEEAEVFLGFLDTVFLVSYAAGLYVCGSLGDRVNMRNLLGFGMASSGLMMFIFGTVSEWAHYYNRLYYTAFWILNGFLQGTSWPLLVAIMGNWYGLVGRGFILGIWTSSASVGNILGAFSVSMSINVGYEYAFLTTAAMLAVWSFVIFVFLHPTPEEAGLAVEAEETEKPDSSVQEEDKSEEIPLTPPTSTEAIGFLEALKLPGVFISWMLIIIIGPLTFTVTEEIPLTPPTSTEAIGFLEALKLPGVFIYSLSFGFLKMVHFSMLFWLPFYLNTGIGWNEVKSARYSMLYDIGAAIGGGLGGLFSDFAGRRIPVVMTMLIFSIISVFGYNFIGNNEVWNGLGMTAVGCFVGGVAHLISAVVAADLGQQDAVKRLHKDAISTITGIVDGTGTVGSAIGQIVVPLLLVSSGWESVFYFLTIMIVCSTLILLPSFLISLGSSPRPKRAEKLVDEE